MPNFSAVFPGGNAFLAVIHVQTEPQVLRNVKIAHEEGADGVFLISHGAAIPTPILLCLYQVVRQMYPLWWIGLNFLDRTTMNALLEVPPGVSGLWVDDAGIDEHAKDPCESARLHWEQRMQKSKWWQGLYFGGVAFKYQQPVGNVARVAKLAVPFMDVITTSGNATGKPPTVAKIRAMRNAIGSHPLAIASGITPENAGKYLGLADCFLVATGVSKSFTELDSERVGKLARIVSAR